MKKIICFFIAVFLLTSSFIGCNKTEVSNGETESPVFSVTKENLELYSIIIPENCDEAIEDVALQLQESVKSITGSRLKIKTDFIAKGSDVYCEEEYEILLGYVDRDVSEEVYLDIRENDSGYVMLGKKIILIGKNATALKSSYNAFFSDVLYAADTKTVLISDGDSKIVEGKYTYESMQIDGVDIKNFKIIYPESIKSDEKKLAESIRTFVKEKTGYTLTCESDKSEPAEYEILIGQTNRTTQKMLEERENSGFGDGKYCILTASKYVWLSSSSSQTLAAAVNKFYEMFEVQDGMASLKVNGAISYESKAVFFSALSYNIYHNFTESRNPDHVLKSIEDQDVDIFGCNEANTEWMTRLTGKFSNTYTCVKGKKSKAGDTGDFCPIFFKTEKFELVESGTKWLSDTPDSISKYEESHTQRIITYAILKDKETDIRFMYIQAHLENNESGYDSTTARKKQSAVLKNFTDSYALPIIIGGDCNTTKISDLSPLLNNSGFVNAPDIAKEKKESGTWVGSAFEAITGGVLDYFFVTKDTVTVNRYEAVDNKINGKYPSDHIPVRIDAVIYQ